ncbi:nitroreductase family deazaflavin-dependent oxidoreductase [Chloroflexales bacterium ZM16-3]|nr:nitroreductase family deazaflavin-dependent oxidoreductase [Chloroflexales bacterium ZM16-3]
MSFFASPIGAWIILYLFTPIDRVLLRLSRGRLSTVAVVVPSLVLISTGAKSGLPRETPLVYLPDGVRIVLIASNGGQPHHPAWYHNLRANPEARVVVGGRTGSYRAHEAAGVEREELWRRAVALYHGYHTYQGRTGGRTIPVMVLEPVD